MHKQDPDCTHYRCFLADLHSNVGDLANVRVRSPADYARELADCEAAEEERALADMLVNQRTQHKFDPTHYKDQYAEKLTQLVDAAVHGKELVAVPADEPRQVLSLLDALTQLPQ